MENHTSTGKNVGPSMGDFVRQQMTNDQQPGRGEPLLSGAEALAAVLAAAGVRTVFGYPGTSELALCDAVANSSAMRLVNARGDKESVFMAAGGCLLTTNRAAAIVHGARGSTNAAGAIATARRNEVGTIVVVGLPNTTSMRFLPPHGEDGLIPDIGAFASWAWEAPAVPVDPRRNGNAARAYVGNIRLALEKSAERPAGPVIIGIPQDVAEANWVPADLLTYVHSRHPVLHDTDLRPAVDLLRTAARPAILIDDFALRHPDIRAQLSALAGCVGAPVLQLRYRRGPMLFERIRADEGPNFVGWLNQFSSAHRDLLAACDLLVTIEDRNMYSRVVGDLPSCRKIAITTAPDKARKNEYLGPDDLILAGDLGRTLADLTTTLGEMPVKPWFSPTLQSEDRTSPESPSEDVEDLRTAVVDAIAHTLANWAEPVIIDDSQMFGGLVSERYDLLPPGTRVFGDHAGFVGGGLASAVGLAIGSGRPVLCTLGDQGFVNAFQGLVAAVQERAAVLFLVCNNGESVSLRKQAAVRGKTPLYLGNTAGLSYRLLADSIGVPAWTVAVPTDLAGGQIEETARELQKTLAEAAAADGPALVELQLPGEPEFWRGVWITAGFDGIGG